ncbi:WD40-repeat-containing domain protein [Pisolithus orientalis]|uniref:WD40-repeat-containing domain protein n=1 Tax=Pisolithus orientalis TaxID=936130 RepID=UPI0022244010|nr:WD40-repeat-containing domain protein [Pisolithus orientalis]KAI6032601.1 WD40-repeat-containing domain protein [Pisolithus orientalis]
MSAPEVYSIAQAPITCHTFNADRSQLALSLNDNNINIYTKQGKEWQVTETLSEHDKVITSVDWAPRTNCIVTASQDRNAYVWSQSLDPNTGRMVWKPTLVLLRINRAATFVRWSPNEDKFAVASGARTIAICSFDPENNWWVARHLKKPIRSTVLSVDWHPNNVLLAAGSADMKARVFSAYIKDVDKRPAPTVWGEKLPFNTVCGEYASPTGGWVHAVGFSPSGDTLAFASHDSSITIVYPGGPTVYTIRLQSLPHVTLTWTAEDTLVAAGHDCQPVVYSGGPGGWSLAGTLDDSATKTGAARVGTVGRLNTAAFNAFRNADTRGHTSETVTDTELHTIHQNTITSVRPHEKGAGGSVLVIWNVSAVSVGGLAGRLGAMRM